MSDKANWYVVHTYSTYENKVAANLEKIIENRKLEDMILDIKVPTEVVVEITEKGQKEKEQKIFPGYILVKMVMSDESWYIVRNTRGVTGFAGSTTKPIPLSQAEVDKLGVEKRVVYSDYAKGDSVKIVDGALSGFVGVVDDISADNSKIKVIVSMFGRETPVDLTNEQISPVE